MSIADNDGHLKLTGNCKLQDVNAEVMSTYAILEEITLYPSSYLVLTGNGYTKHYYAGAERVAARLGSGELNALDHVIDYDGKPADKIEPYLRTE